jgi:hypothetical protein
LPGPLLPPAALYVWPYQSLDYLPAAIAEPAVILAETGSLARGDLEAVAYPLFVRYRLEQPPAEWPLRINFDNQLELRQVILSAGAQETLQVDLYWSTGPVLLAQPVVAFVHIMEAGQLVAQDDAQPAQGNWPLSWWQPGLIVQDRHLIQMGREYDPSRHQLLIGLYDAATQLRLPVLDQASRPVADSWPFSPGRE